MNYACDLNIKINSIIYKYKDACERKQNIAKNMNSHVGCFECATAKYSSWSAEPPEALITLSVNILIRMAVFRALIS